MSAKTVSEDGVNNGARPFKELMDSGFLWLINASVFHPRGFAMALHVDDDGDVTGWSLQGDGTERWAFVEDPSKWPEGRSPDDAFDATLREFDIARGEIPRSTK